MTHHDLRPLDALCIGHIDHELDLRQRRDDAEAGLHEAFAHRLHDGSEVEAEPTVRDHDRLGLLPAQDPHQLGVPGPVELGPQPLEGVAAHEVERLAHDELVDGVAERTGQEPGRGRQCPLGQSSRVEPVRDGPRHLPRDFVLDQRVGRQRSHAREVAIGVEDLVAPPHRHEAEHRQEAGQRRQQHDSGSAQLRCGGHASDPHAPAWRRHHPVRVMPSRPRAARVGRRPSECQRRDRP